MIGVSFLSHVLPWTSIGGPFGRGDWAPAIKSDGACLTPLEDVVDPFCVTMANLVAVDQTAWVSVGSQISGETLGSIPLKWGISLTPRNTPVT